jgi:hypothetical protein
MTSSVVVLWYVTWVRIWASFTASRFLRPEGFKHAESVLQRMTGTSDRRQTERICFAGRTRRGCDTRRDTGCQFVGIVGWGRGGLDSQQVMQHSSGSIEEWYCDITIKYHGFGVQVGLYWSDPQAGSTLDTGRRGRRLQQKLNMMDINWVTQVIPGCNGELVCQLAIYSKKLLRRCCFCVQRRWRPECATQSMCETYTQSDASAGHAVGKGADPEKQYGKQSHNGTTDLSTHTTIANHRINAWQRKETHRQLLARFSKNNFTI